MTFKVTQNAQHSRDKALIINSDVEEIFVQSINFFGPVSSYVFFSSIFSKVNLRKFTILLGASLTFRFPAAHIQMQNWQNIPAFPAPPLVI